jgi:hypothetical protein
MCSIMVRRKMVERVTTYLFIIVNFLLGYIHYTGGIHSDNSDLTYIIHYLHSPHHFSPLYF